MKTDLKNDSPLLQKLSVRVESLTGVTAGRSRFGPKDGKAWFVGRTEIAHAHGPDRIDVRLPRPLQKAHKKDRRVIPRRSASDWIEFRMASGDDIQFVFDRICESAQSLGATGDSQMG